MRWPLYSPIEKETTHLVLLSTPSLRVVWVVQTGPQPAAGGVRDSAAANGRDSLLPMAEVAAE